jgi:glycosyltransferase involved in cell wall biosynthesis
MSKHSFEVIYITNLPSFYKINLLNKIAECRNIVVIFTDENSNQRNDDFYKGERKFKYITIANYSIVSKLIIILKLLLNNKNSKLILVGWDHYINWIAAFFHKKGNNAVVVESSILESTTSGIKGFIKRLFLKKIDKAYAAGKSQMSLLKELGFNGEIKKTKGVGIFNIVPQPPYTPKKEVKNYIYVGRFSPEKNIEYLIATFNSLPEFTLNLIGYGPEEKYLKTIAKENINFLGSISNEKLYIEYQKNDVFILPSLSEPWGLVVEEALNNGLPVIVSNKVGCIDEVVKDGVNGIIFEIESINGLIDAINKISNIQFYNNLRLNISKMNFEEIRQHQVNCYLNS